MSVNQVPQELENRFAEQFKEMRRELEALKTNQLVVFIPPQFTADPTGTDLHEGMIWTNTTSHQTKQYINGVVKVFTLT